MSKSAGFNESYRLSLDLLDVVDVVGVEMVEAGEMASTSSFTSAVEVLLVLVGGLLVLMAKGLGVRRAVSLSLDGGGDEAGFAFDCAAAR